MSEKFSLSNWAAHVGCFLVMVVLTLFGQRPR